MSRMTRVLGTVVITATLGLALPALIPAGTASAQTTTNTLRYEFDNGAQWTLQRNAAALSATIPAASWTGYADAGIVVDLGPLSRLSVPSSPPVGPPLCHNLSPVLFIASTCMVADNLWISDGPSEANTPGTHSLSDPVDFAYGSDNYDGSYYMMADPGGSYAGLNATLAQLQAEHPGAEAYAWIGVTYTSGMIGKIGQPGGIPNPFTVSVTSVGGRAVGNRTISFTFGGDGSVSVEIH